MKKLFLVSPEPDETLGDVEGIFDARGNLLASWDSNDATWRTEYFNPFMRDLGFDIRGRVATARDIIQLKKAFGIE